MIPHNLASRVLYPKKIITDLIGINVSRHSLSPVRFQYGLSSCYLCRDACLFLISLSCGVHLIKKACFSGGNGRTFFSVLLFTGVEGDFACSTFALGAAGAACPFALGEKIHNGLIDVAFVASTSAPVPGCAPDVFKLSFPPDVVMCPSPFTNRLKPLPTILI